MRVYKQLKHKTTKEAKKFVLSVYVTLLLVQLTAIVVAVFLFHVLKKICGAFPGDVATLWHGLFTVFLVVSFFEVTAFGVKLVWRMSSYITLGLSQVYQFKAVNDPSKAGTTIKSDRVTVIL